MEGLTLVAVCNNNFSHVMLHSSNITKIQEDAYDYPEDFDPQPELLQPAPVDTPVAVSWRIFTII